jgi:hypothetical protein
MTPRTLTRWKILDKACLAVDPACKVSVPKLARERVERRLDALSPEAFEAEMAETVEFLARMRARTLEIWAAFQAETRAMDADGRADPARATPPGLYAAYDAADEARFQRNCMKEVRHAA